MAAPAPAPKLFSAITSNAALWSNHAPNYNDVSAQLCHGAQNQAAVMRGVVGCGSRTPVVIAFQIEGDEDNVYVGHSPQLFHTDPLETTDYDAHIVVMLGNDLDTMTPLVLPDNAFSRITATRCPNITNILGPDGHGAVPPAFR